MSTTIYIDPKRTRGKRDPRIYGHFIEHFHRQVYGGIYEPGSPLADEEGMRTDVLEAIAEISPAIMRWPGGCFVSAYPWKYGVGPERRPHYDKAWFVEDSNEFGTDEFISFCRKIDAVPYICTNGGTGTAEEMSDWVEYCNLRDLGEWARLRVRNGAREPHGVPIWSIGNENYGTWEMGAKSAVEWADLVKESAKMMRAVDPTIELSAASVADVDWNIHLLREAGAFLDWISVHHYWDGIHETNALSPYERCMAFSTRAGEPIEKTEHILGALGYLGKIKIAFDEWNLRGWYHPKSDPNVTDRVAARDENDRNESYTMADAIFSACFLNECLRHCNTVKMANFAPTVNTRGMIYTHADGIVLRSTYRVFELFTKQMGDTLIDSWIDGNGSFDVDLGSDGDGGNVRVPMIDAVATSGPSAAGGNGGSGSVQLSLINRSPDAKQTVKLVMPGVERGSAATLYSIAPDSKDAYNGVDAPSRVSVEQQELRADTEGRLTVELPPHSVHVVRLA